MLHSYSNTLGRATRYTVRLSRPLSTKVTIPRRDSRIFNVSPDIRDAVENKQPVVALESTIYTHGLPYPQNIDLAYELNSLVRENGAIPATCAVFEGVARVGITGKELEILVESSGVRKVSRRDLGFLTGKALAGELLYGGTTISGTMILAHLAGIKVFATGGLGGVHRGGETSLDISADLTELGRTPVAVVSSGPKGFLDIPRTLEYLETQGALVATFADGREGPVDFPAFWARDSGVRSPMVIQDEMEAAAIIYAQSELPISSGMLFANPLPVEFSIPVNEMSDIIKQALEAATRAGATGNRNTPFVLNAIKELSGGRSVPANRALVKANVIKGARIAVELAKLEKHMSRSSEVSVAAPGMPIKTEISRLSEVLQDTSASSTRNSKVDILVAGSLAVDVSCDYTPPASAADKLSPELHTSNPSTISDSLGGVAHNIARAAHLMGASVKLCSAVADDLAGRGALAAMVSSGLDTSAIQVLPASSGAKTARYVCVNDAQKNLVLAMSDMSIVERPVADFASTWGSYLTASTPKWLVVDGNWDSAVLHCWLSAARETGVLSAFEPVSTSKSLRLLSALNQPSVFPNPTVDLATPNVFELQAMHSAAYNSGLFDSTEWWKVVDAFGIPTVGARVQLSLATSPALVDAGVPQQALQLLPFVPCLLTKLGADGVLLTQLLPVGDKRLEAAESAPYILSRSVTEERGVGGVYMRLFPAAEVVKDEDVISVNGVGDTFLGALMATLVDGDIRNVNTVENCVNIAQQAGVLTLKSREAVSPALQDMKRLIVR